MKREKLKYEVYNHYSWFGGDECCICEKEFRRESGFRLYLCGGFSSCVHICSDHATSKEEAVKVFDQQIKRKSENVPPPSPR